MESAHGWDPRRCVAVMYHTLAVFCSNFSIHLFIYLLDYKDEVDRRVFKKQDWN